jgi:hypothetical protein
MASPYQVIRNIVNKVGFDIVKMHDPVAYFHADQYLRHNARRLEHLTSLNIPVSGKTVLEVGSGIGDHSHYYLDRGCEVTITEARTENLRYLKRRYPGCNIQFLDLENPTPVMDSPFDIVHCYGLLYHLNNPALALEFIANNTKDLLFLETRVSSSDANEEYYVTELKSNPTQSFSGIGCRPTRPWIYKQLKGLFEYVYLPITQPNHEDFPLDWTLQGSTEDVPKRAIFIASREKLECCLLTPHLLDKHKRHE